MSEEDKQKTKGKDTKPKQDDRTTEEKEKDDREDIIHTLIIELD